MELQSCDRESCVRLELVETESHYYPSARCVVEANLEGMQVSQDLWLDAPAIERFILDLNQLDKVRAGSASIESMSPKELILSFQASDRVGHVSVSVTVSKWRQTLAWSVTCTFEIDPMVLPTLSSEFQRFLDAIRWQRSGPPTSEQ